MLVFCRVEPTGKIKGADEVIMGSAGIPRHASFISGRGGRGWYIRSPSVFSPPGWQRRWAGERWPKGEDGTKDILADTLSLRMYLFCHTLLGWEGNLRQAPMGRLRETALPSPAEVALHVVFFFSNSIPSHRTIQPELLLIFFLTYYCSPRYLCTSTTLPCPLCGIR